MSCTASAEDSRGEFNCEEPAGTHFEPSTKLAIQANHAEICSRVDPHPTVGGDYITIEFGQVEGLFAVCTNDISFIYNNIMYFCVNYFKSPTGVFFRQYMVIPCG